MAKDDCVCTVRRWLLAACLMLAIQGAAAQTTAAPTTVPPWGIALLTLMAVILAVLLISLCCLPFLCRRSRSQEPDQTSSDPFYIPHFRLSKRCAQT